MTKVIKNHLRSIYIFLTKNREKNQLKYNLFLILEFFYFKKY